MRIGERKGWPLVRFIVPKQPRVNIFSGAKTACLGPLAVATSLNKMWGVNVEVIDENICGHGCPKDKNGLPDHADIQKSRPASIVCFYCGITSTMERVFETAKFYRSENAVIIAGGLHSHYCPEESLDNGVDVVVHGQAEYAIREIVSALLKNGDISHIPGISFRENGKKNIYRGEMLHIQDLEDIPFPDFGLLRYAPRKIKHYPISRIRGCSKNCEFCSVKGKPKWSSAERLFENVNYLVETRGAEKFFIVDDNSADDPEGTAEFFRLVRKKHENRLRFTLQIRLEAAKDTEYLETMKKAGVDMVCVGFESPIAEDLKAMRKGIKVEEMVAWTRKLRKYFWVHGMFIFGYPHKDHKSSISAAEMVKRYKSFIRATGLYTIQVLHPIPLVGSELRERLLKEGRIFPLELVPWSMYDGNFLCFKPDNMTVSELQNIPLQIMRWFYHRSSLLKIPIRTVYFPVDYLARGFHSWHRDWWKDIVNFGGSITLKRHEKQTDMNFVKRLEKYCGQQ